jgi:N-carbamoylputrescine amidase
MSASIAVVQSSFSDDMANNIAKIEGFIRDAASAGAQLVLTPELFQGHYFCTTQDSAHFARAFSVDDHPAVLALQKLAAALNIYLPVSFFERDGSAYYNSMAMAGPDGKVMGVYRKTHIPDGPGYQEKFYFRPGDTGYKVWNTPFGNIGIGICWDQWYPEVARGMMLKGADILLYPTAIGSEPYDPALDTSERWQLAHRGHAVSNVVPVGAANRVGKEGEQTYYGSSFLCDQAGVLVQKFGKTEEGVLMHCFDFAAIRHERAAWGFFRDRRPEIA